MPTKSVVTDVRNRKDSAFLRFKDVGGIHIRDWHHIWTTTNLKRGKLDDLEGKVFANSVLNEFQFIRKEHSRYFNFGQLVAPFWVIPYLPDEFVTGMYKRQLWWRLAWPGSVAELKEEIPEVLSERNSLEDRLRGLRESLPARVGKSDRYCSEIFNRLNESFEEYSGDLELVRDRIKRTRVRKSVSEGLLFERAEIAEGVRDLTSELRDYNGSIEWDKDTEKLDVFIDGHNWMKVLRALNFEEREKQKIYTADLEMPLWDTDNPVVSWLGACAFRGDEVLGRGIVTIHDLEREEIDGYQIKSGLEKEINLVNTTKDSVKRVRPDRLAIFNTRYDLMKLREAGERGGSEFNIGEDDSRPVFEASLNFFERVGLTGVEVEDILKGMQIYDYLPNKKLKTVLPHATRHLPEMAHKVDLSYKEMEEAELAGEFEKIVEYLPMDVEANRLIMRSPDYLKFSELCCFFSRFRMPYTWLIYSSRTAKDIFKRFYFERVGSYWETVRYAHKNRKKEMERESKLKEDFKKWFGGMIGSEVDGLYENVRKVYLPLGEFLRSELRADRRKFDTGKKDKERKPKKISLGEIVDQIFFYGDNIDKKDFQKKFQFSLFTSSMADFMIVDFMDWFKERRALVEEMEGEGIDYDRFCEKHDYFVNILESESDWGVHHLRKGTLTLDGMRRHLDDFIHEYLDDHGISKEDFHMFSLQQAQLDRKGNRFGANFNIHPGNMLRTLEEKVVEVKNYFEEQGLEVIGRDGLYLYVTGESEFENSPVIPVDEIENVLVCGKVYYERYGALKGFKLEEEAKHTWTVWEMDVFGNFIDSVLKGDPIGALCDLYNDLDCFRMGKGLSGEVLLWHSKSSGRYRGFENGDRVYFYANEEKYNEAKARVAKKTLKIPFLKQSLTEDLGDKKGAAKYLKRFAENPSIERLGEDLIGQLDEKKFVNKLERIYSKQDNLSDDERFIVENGIRDFASFFEMMVGDDEILIEKLYRIYRPIQLRPLDSFEPDIDMYLERSKGRSGFEGFKHDAAELIAPLTGMDNAYYIVQHALKDSYNGLDAEDFEEMLIIKQ